jgi:hypothetical protein
MPFGDQTDIQRVLPDKSKRGRDRRGVECNTGIVV